MIELTSDRGFQRVVHEGYPTERSAGPHQLLVQSSVIGDYPDSFDRPGTSALWVGEHHHLNREEVAQLRAYLDNWLATGFLFCPQPPVLALAEGGS